MPYTYEYPHPAVAVDIALFTVAGQLQDLRLQVLLIARALLPQRYWLSFRARRKTLAPVPSAPRAVPGKAKPQSA